MAQRLAPAVKDFHRVVARKLECRPADGKGGIVCSSRRAASALARRLGTPAAVAESLPNLGVDFSAGKARVGAAGAVR